MNVASNTANTETTALVGAFTNSSTLKFYSGTIPATPETAIGAQVLLATVTLPSSSAMSSSAGVLTAAAITSVSIGTTGTAAFARWVKSDGTTVIADLTVGTSGSDVTVNSTSFTSGATLSVSSFTYTVPSV